jgi:thioredoxin-related protein
MGCTLAKPIVDGIEKELQGKLLVMRVNIQTADGKELARRFNSIATPTFILFDKQGQEIYRSIGQIDPQAVRDFVTGVQ